VPATVSPLRSAATITAVPAPVSTPRPDTTRVVMRAALLPRRRAMPSTTYSAKMMTARAIATAAPSQTTPT
jgi:hypothetical protein